MGPLTRAALAAAASAFALSAMPASAQEWSPDRPINVVVPWGAGGSTDQVTRVTAPIIAEALGQSLVVVNQPGGGSAAGATHGGL
jgi:tripartite-type tricarboxylate transporter receptor subunit TctC